MDAPMLLDVRRDTSGATRTRGLRPPITGWGRAVWAGGGLLALGVLASCQCLPKGSAVNAQRCTDPSASSAASCQQNRCDAGGCEPHSGWADCRGGAGCGPNLYIGCIDTWRVRRYALASADKAWRRCHNPGGRGSCHFRDGFDQAFVDLAEGGDGTPPGVPPERYWWCTYRSACGQRFAEEWFAGYEAGVEAARALAFCPDPGILLGPSAGGAGSPPPDYTSGRTP
jgi:hypothetical protein